MKMWIRLLFWNGRGTGLQQSIPSNGFRIGPDFVGRVAEEDLAGSLLCIASIFATTTAENRQTQTDPQQVTLLVKSAVVRDSRRIVLHDSDRQINSRSRPANQIVPLFRASCQSHGALIHQRLPYAFSPPLVCDLC